MPSIVNSVEISKKKAIFKEDIQLLSEAFTSLVNNGYDNSKPITVNLATVINATKVCPTNTVTEGCVSVAPLATIVNFGPVTQGLLLPNGSVLHFSTATTTPLMNWFFLDYNGTNTKAPVLPTGMTGDTMVLEYNLRDIKAERTPGSGPLNPGQIKPSLGYTNDLAFFNAL